MEGYFESRLVVYKYKQLVVAGVTGTIERKLSHIGPLINERYPDMEIARVQCQPERDFLAMFIFDPPRDITIAQGGVDESLIVGYALDQKELTETIKGIARTIGFIPHRTLDSKVAQIWKREFELEKRTYDSCITISQHFQKSLEAIFGMVGYSNFLRQYNNIEEEEASKLAAQKFGIPPETFQ